MIKIQFYLHVDEIIRIDSTLSGPTWTKLIFKTQEEMSDMKKIKLVIAAAALMGMVSSSTVYADGFAPGEGLYLGAFAGLNTGIVQPKVAATAATGGEAANTLEATEGGLGLQGIEGGILAGYGYKMGDLYAGLEGEWAAGDTEFKLTSTTDININNSNQPRAAQLQRRGRSGEREDKIGGRREIDCSVRLAPWPLLRTPALGVAPRARRFSYSYQCEYRMHIFFISIIIRMPLPIVRPEKGNTWQRERTRGGRARYLTATATTTTPTTNTATTNNAIAITPLIMIIQLLICI